MLISNSRKIEPVKTSVQLQWYSKEKCIVLQCFTQTIQVWRYLNKNTIYFFKKHYVQLKRKQVLQSTGYAGCRKHLHRTWNQFKKNFWALSIEGTWLYTNNSTTTRNAVVEKVSRPRSSDVVHTRQVEFRNFSFQPPHLRAGFSPGNPDPQSHAGTPKEASSAYGILEPP